MESILLDKESVYFPQEIVDYGKSTQAVILPTEERMAISAGIASSKEKSKFHEMWKHLKGTSCEISVFNYIKDSTRGLSALFWSYDQIKTKIFLGSSDRTSQEYDVILVLAKQRKFVVVEVKSYTNKAQKKTLEPLTKGRTFFKDLKRSIGQDLFEDWEYIGVVALPNVLARDQLKNRSIFEKEKIVLITAKEMCSCNFLDVLQLQKHKKQSYANIAYKSLVKLLFAAQYAAVVNKSHGYVGFQLAAPKPPWKVATSKLTGDVEAVGVGMPEQLEMPSKIDFSDLKDTPLGSIQNIMFWNQVQYDIINSDHRRRVITGEYGSGKTIILMAEIIKCLRQNQKCIFVVDRHGSENMFDERITIFCKELCIEYYHIDFGIDDEDVEELESALENNPCSTVIIDEVSNEDFIKICHATEKYPQMTVVCAMCPRIGEAIHMKIPKIEFSLPGNWKSIRLTKVMRNCSSIYRFVEAFSPEPLISEQSSTVIGPKPKLIPIFCISHMGLGLLSALKQLKGENKFVIARHSKMLSVEEVEHILKESEIDVPLYKYYPANKIKLFFEAEKGCMIAHDYHFSGTEIRSLICFTGGNDKRVNGNATTHIKDILMRCTTNLVVVALLSPANYKNMKKSLDTFDFIIPYPRGSRAEHHVLSCLRYNIGKECFPTILENIEQTRQNN